MTIKNNQKKSRKQTKQKKKYCEICCKYYSCHASYKTHMKNFHGQTNLNPNASSEDSSIFNSKLYFTKQKKTRDRIRKTDNQKPNIVYIKLHDESKFLPPKITGIIDENHIKALREFCVVKQPFYCIFCKAICADFDHYQIQQWCTLGDV